MRKQLSIVIPVYRNSQTLHELHRQLHPILSSQAVRAEILFVNDACPEGSDRVLNELEKKDPQVVILNLKENVGQHRAVLAGLSRSEGDRVVVMDADLQDPPAAIPSLLDKLEEGYAAAFAGRRGRYESPLRLLTSRLIKQLLHLLTPLPPDAGLFVALNHEMVERLKAFERPGPSVVAMIGCTGLPMASIPVERIRRSSGRSAYSGWMRLRIGCKTVTWLVTQKVLSAPRHG